MPSASFAIDWESQWAQHGANYRDGYVHFGSLKLKPGPGFGDLSHPTTHLVLNLMANRLEGKNILDIGCGSGILSLAAAMQAKSVWGIDIDPNAIEHSRENALLNHQKSSFGTAADFIAAKPQAPITILLNMIESEQKEAWDSLKPIHHLVSEAFVSGILKQDRSRYIALTASWGWILKEEREQEGWLGFHFQI